MDKKISWNSHFGKFIESKNNYELIECEKCKFKHIIPIPDKITLEKFYNEHFFDIQKPDYSERQKEDLEWWNLVYSERYNRFENSLQSKGKKILDIGCGPGFFLKLGKELGWDTLGIEPSQTMANHAKSLGLKIINSDINEKITSDIGQFDVIHMQGVMEHLADPKIAVELCFKLLKPGGVFCTIVANDYNPLQDILKKNLAYPSWWFVPPEHINYFSISSIRDIATSSGFEEVNITTTFPMEFFLLMGDNYVGNDSLGRICHTKRKNFEFIFEKSGMFDLKKQIYKNFSNLNLGRDIDATFIKPLTKNI